MVGQNIQLNIVIHGILYVLLMVLKQKDSLCSARRLKRAKGYYNRLVYLSDLLQSGKNGQNSPLINSQNLTVFVHDDFKYLFP